MPVLVSPFDGYDETVALAYSVRHFHSGGNIVMSVELPSSSHPPSLRELLQSDLWARYGSPLLQGERLREALGYPTSEALRQAIHRGTVPVPVFEIKHRRGHHALLIDVAEWLARARTMPSLSE